MKKLFALCILAFASNLYAGKCEDCTIKFLGCSYVYEKKQTCNLEFNENISNPAPCASEANKNRVVFDMETEGGKAAYSIALAAYMGNKKVTHLGYNSCTTLPNEMEDIGNFYLGNPL
ncbi:MAG: hypothetical protein AAGB12_02075 [Pseudomonadota bacterium]